MSRIANRSANATARQPRCAIYTRVSSDAGLEQEFNSLDNQREAAEAHIRSQQFEGWQLVPTAFDDGGFSGGSIERPGLQRLLADVRADLVDIIVVYKVDRLTRSLADFAKLVELFDAHGVSFVSVTQSFNTTSSMGRLAAHEIEELVVASLRTRLENRGSALSRDALGSASPALGNPGERADIEPLSDEAMIAQHLDRVIVRQETLELIWKPVADAEPPEPMTVPWSRPVHTRKREIIIPKDSTQTGVHPIRAEARARLIAAIARARQRVAELTANPHATTTSIAAREKLSERSVRMTLPMAFLYPAIVKAAIVGTLPFGTGVMALTELPMDWKQQGRVVAGTGRTDPRRCAV